MYKPIRDSLVRAEELIRELNDEYDKALHAHEVSDRAVQLTHEVFEKLRGILDRLARRYWEKHISPNIPSSERNRAVVYFPIVADQHSLDSLLGRWRWKTVRHDHQQIYDYLISQQPFQSSANDELRILNELATTGKHIDLVPQTRTESRRITVSSSGGGKVSWNPDGVRFGPGVQIGGAPVDPLTQRVVPTPGVTEEITVWVSFDIEGYGVNASALCSTLVKRVEEIAEQMSELFDL